MAQVLKANMKIVVAPHTGRVDGNVKVKVVVCVVRGRTP